MKRGRPVIDDAKRKDNPPIPVRLNDSDYYEFKVVADQLDIPPSVLARSIIKKHLQDFLATFVA